MPKFRVERIKNIARYDLPAPLAREIGRFLAAWAYLEHYVQTLIWLQLDFSAAEGRILLREPRVTERLDMLRDLGEIREIPMDYVLLADLRKRADPLAAKRHLLAHSLWSVDRGVWCALLTRGTWAATQQEIENYPTGSKAVLPEAHAVTAEDVAGWTQLTRKLIEDIKTLNKQHRVVPKPSPQKQKPRSAQRNQTRDQRG
jgi:hypothetical protein